jgi:hypothetical protein
MQPFYNDDQGYMNWVAANPNGYVVNRNVPNESHYEMLHRADCSTINGIPANGRRWTACYIKECHQRRPAATIRACRRCNPYPNDQEMEGGR